MINYLSFVADLGRLIMSAAMRTVGLLWWSRFDLVFISMIDLDYLVTLPKLFNGIAMSIRDKFIGWLEILY